MDGERRAKDSVYNGQLHLRTPPRVVHLKGSSFWDTLYILVHCTLDTDVPMNGLQQPQPLTWPIGHWPNEYLQWQLNTNYRFALSASLRDNIKLKLSQFCLNQQKKSDCCHFIFYDQQSIKPWCFCQVRKCLFHADGLLVKLQTVFLARLGQFYWVRMTRTD